MEDLIRVCTGYVALCVEAIAAAMIAYGTIEALVGLAPLLIGRSLVGRRRMIRMQFAGWLLLGLIRVGRRHRSHHDRAFLERHRPIGLDRGDPHRAQLLPGGRHRSAAKQRPSRLAVRERVLVGRDVRKMAKDAAKTGVNRGPSHGSTGPRSRHRRCPKGGG